MIRLHVRTKPSTTTSHPLPVARRQYISIFWSCERIITAINCSKTVLTIPSMSQRHCPSLLFLFWSKFQIWYVNLAQINHKNQETRTNKTFLKRKSPIKRIGRKRHCLKHLALLTWGCRIYTLSLHFSITFLYLCNFPVWSFSWSSIKRHSCLLFFVAWNSTILADEEVAKG